MSLLLLAAAAAAQFDTVHRPAATAKKHNNFACVAAVNIRVECGDDATVVTGEAGLCPHAAVEVVREHLSTHAWGAVWVNDML